MSDPAPAPIPYSGEPPSLPSVTGERSLRNAFWRVFGTPSFFRLWLAQMVSGLGDWIGVFAIISVAGRVSTSAAAIGLVMTARMLPGLVLAPLGGALVDRWNRKTVMVVSDLGRAALLVLIPFWDSLLGLVVIAFCLEVFTLMWGPAKDASVPNVVASKEQLASANSLNLVAGFGTFPIGAGLFAALTGVAAWLGGFDALSRFSVDQESLAIWLDSLTFLGSALLISRLALPEGERKVRRIDWSETYRDMVDGLRFIRSEPLVRGVMVGFAGGLLGGGMLIPLGRLFTKEVLAEPDAAAFGILMTALGLGAAIGVLTLLAVQRRVPARVVFQIAIVACGASIIAMAMMSTLTAAFLLVLSVGAWGGAVYVSGYTVLQTSVRDDLRGRTFAALYTVIRLALLLSLTVGPFVASLLGSASEHALTDQELTLGGATIAMPGVRLALLLGGLVTVAAGWLARRRMRMADSLESAQGGGER